MKIDPTLTGSSEHNAALAAPRLIPGITALLLGAVFLLGAGFAPVSAVHNAAHDTRHAFAFPCH